MLASSFLLSLCLVLNLSAHLPGTIAAACGSRCTYNQHTPGLMERLGRSVHTYFVSCEVPSSEDASVCEMDVEQFTADPLPADYFIHYLKLTCQQPRRVTFTNNNKQHVDVGIGYIVNINCDILWKDLAFYGTFIDLVVLLMMNFRDTFGEERQFWSNRTELPPSLQNVGTLSFVTGNITHVPEILTKYEWRKMRELEISNTFIEEIPQELATTMPLLQSLIAVNNSISAPLAIPFPWTPDWQDLPYNLSRTLNANDHYAYSQNISTKPSRYRRVLYMDDNYISDLSAFQFQSAGPLEKLSLSNNRIHNVHADTFNNIHGLEALTLRNNVLTYLPHTLFDNLTDLIFLDLNYNHLSSIPTDIFKRFHRIEYLSISYNNVSVLENGTFANLCHLKEIDLSSNAMSTVEEDAFDFDSPSLQRLFLHNNSLTFLPAFFFLTRNLFYLDLTTNQLTFEGLLKSVSRLDSQILVFMNRQSASMIASDLTPLRVKRLVLHNNSIDHLDIDNIDDKTLDTLKQVMWFFRIELKSNCIICDCHSYRMYQHLLQLSRSGQEYNEYHTREWICCLPARVSGKQIISVSNTTFMCPQQLEKCPSPCKCLVRSVDNVVVVDCSSRGLATLPDYVPDDTKYLLLRNNTLSTLNATKYYLSSLFEMDIRESNVHAISKEFLWEVTNIDVLKLSSNKLTSIPESISKLQGNISLHNNPWKCDCKATWMRQWLLTHREHLENVDGVVCATGSAQGRSLIEVPEKEMVCPWSTELIIGIAVSITCGVFLFITLPVYIFHRRRDEIEQRLYIHFKWRLQNEPANIEDKEYDAMVSYSSSDENWTEDYLVKRLSVTHKLCLHEREFLPGTLIAENIDIGIQKSRRMITVLSRRYLESPWCLMEFGEAYRRLQLNRKFIILIVLDKNALQGIADVNVRNYIASHTYLLTDDKWFWNKLEYAMPEESITLLKGNGVADSVGNHGGITNSINHDDVYPVDDDTGVRTHGGGGDSSPRDRPLVDENSTLLKC